MLIGTAFPLKRGLEFQSPPPCDNPIASAQFSHLGFAHSGTHSGA